ncbi:MAG: SprT family zinc-dependent metalloprotease [Candidatus Caldatribacteriota bacterium]|nr:SprT family zinc-dependent metalloprotease [Candidatus Caldatribacteriota bacterium]
MKIEKIIRSKRKTISLHISDDATLIVKAPNNASNEMINRVVIKHKNWVEKRKREVQSRDLKFTKKEFIDGESFLYLGNYYKLRLVENQEIPLNFENVFYLSIKCLPNAKEIFINWYKKRAYEKICQRVKLYAQKEGFKYNRIKITNALKTWGSCSHKGNLNFTWRLIMAPLNIVDYVVVHELTHLNEKNHSRIFWDKVENLMPEYKRYNEWLKKNSHLLKL